MTTKIIDLLAKVSDVRNNPAEIQRVMLSALEAMEDNDYDVVDPTNPFVFLLETACVTAGAGLVRNETLLRKQYATLAQEEDDLYNHMTDDDYANRFAVPSRTEVIVMLNLDEVKRRAIDAGNGIKKMVIPKDTEIVVEGISFTMQYPIEIRVMPHGGVQVMYDTSVTSPLYSVESNLLNYKQLRMPANFAGLTNEIIMLAFSIPVHQFKITVYNDQLSASSGFTKTYAFNDQFYYCRVYVSKANEEWQEIVTTHSDQVYDVNTPTAILRVTDNTINVKIPQIYFTNGAVERAIRIDIYTTKGALEMSLDRYQPNNFIASWKDLSRFESVFNSPIREFNTMTLYSDEKVTGGRNKLSFDELRKRVIDNALGSIKIPITPAQLAVEMDTLGYSIMKEIDTITNRLYLATRALPKPSDINLTVNDASTFKLTTSIGCMIRTLQTSIDTLKTIDIIRDNGNRVTLDSGALFKIQYGILSPVEKATVNAINNASADVKVQYLMNNRFVYTPFHYVFDMNDNNFDVRAYYLDNPVIASKQFIKENQTTNLGVTTASWAISKEQSGYKLVVVTQSSDEFKLLNDSQVHVQLSFIPSGEIERARLNGVLYGRTENNEFIFTFDLNTNFDVDKNHFLQLTNFNIYEAAIQPYGISLDANLDIVYAVSGYNIGGMVYSDIDLLLAPWMVPSDTVAVIQEQFNVDFGNDLTGLWSRSRTISGPTDYLKYEVDEPAIYSETIYERDPLTGRIIITYDEVEDKINYTVLHTAGDPVLDGFGQPVFAHRKGDVKLDPNGNPIPVANRKLLRQADLLLLDGSFAYVTESTVFEYVTETIQSLVNWIAKDIRTISERLLENTQMLYYPKVTLGDVGVYVEGGISTTIESDQSFVVKYYLDKQAHNDTALRADLATTAIKMISSALESQTVSVIEMARLIKDQVKNDIIDVTVTGLGGTSNNYEIVTTKDPSIRLNIKKRPTVLADGRITVQDDVVIEYIRHTSD